MQSLTGNVSYPNYTDAHVPILADVPPPLDNNLLQAKTLLGEAAPAPTYALNWLIEFHADATGTNRAYVNNLTYAPPSGASAIGNKSVLFDFLSSTTSYESHFQFDNFSKLNYSIGDGAHPFVLPLNQTVMVFINNTDTGEHPIHLHGHNFWVVATSDFPEAETLYKPFYLLRDVVGVPAGGWAKIIFTTNNPGIWVLHCHIDWHFEVGLASIIIEGPEALPTLSKMGKILPIPESMLSACTSPHFQLMQPTGEPIALISEPPSYFPSILPAANPSNVPSTPPSCLPTLSPTTILSNSLLPTMNPSATPTRGPSTPPSISPSNYPTVSTTSLPTNSLPTMNPSATPTKGPSTPPSISPSNYPTVTLPTMKPSTKPTKGPTTRPSISPSNYPTISASSLPTTFLPTMKPSTKPTRGPSTRPSINPTNYPSVSSTSLPITFLPTTKPTAKPTKGPPTRPSISPTNSPIASTSKPKL